MRTLTIAAIAMISITGAAHAQVQNCRSISDSLERLRCYDAREDNSPSPSPAAPATPAEDPLIAAAKASVRKMLRDPASARFDSLKVRSDKTGKKAVCGTVNSRNSMNGMTGPKMFVFDGTNARIMVAGEGPEDGTSMGRYILGAVLGETLKLHERFCKN